MSDEKAKTLHMRLLEIQKSVDYLKKDNQSKQYNYVSSSQTLAAIRGLMDEESLLLVPAVTSANVHPGVVYSGKMHLTEMHMTFTWVCADNPEDKLECGWYGQGVDDGEKGVGKALTYAEKYFLLKFFHIATDKDDPDEAGNHPAARPQQSGGSSAPQAGNAPQSQGAPAGGTPHSDTSEFGPCPKCGCELRKREGSKGPFVGCTSYRGKENPGCGFMCNVEKAPPAVAGGPGAANQDDEDPFGEDDPPAGEAPVPRPDLGLRAEYAGTPGYDDEGYPTTPQGIDQFLLAQGVETEESRNALRDAAAEALWGFANVDAATLTADHIRNLARKLETMIPAGGD